MVTCEDFALLRSDPAVLKKNAVLPSRGVAVKECIVVPVPPLSSSEEKRTGEKVVDAQASVMAKYLSHLFDSAIWWHAGMQHGSAVDKTLGATVREEQELYGVDEVVAGKLLFSLQRRNSQERPHLR